MPHTIARDLLAAARQKERDSLITGWGEDTIPVEVVVQEYITNQRGFRPSLQLLHIAGEMRDFIAWRDASLYQVHRAGGVA